MPNQWDKLIPFYREFVDEYEYFAPMIELIEQVIAHRDTSQVYPHTSHAVLCLTKQRTYEEWLDKPFVSIEATGTGWLRFNFIVPKPEGDIYRERRASITCGPEQALDIYDEVPRMLFDS